MTSVAAVELFPDGGRSNVDVVITELRADREHGGGEKLEVISE